MGQKRIRFDGKDADGIQFDIKLVGNITPAKVLKVLELMNAMDITTKPAKSDLSSIGSKIWFIVNKHYSTSNFTSNYILEKYEDEYNEPIKLSVISTYLFRFSNRGRIARTRRGREWIYKNTELETTMLQSKKILQP